MEGGNTERALIKVCKLFANEKAGRSNQMASASQD